MRRLSSSIIGTTVVLGLLAAWTPSVEAHGEAAQDAFIRTRAIAFYDVKFSRTEMRIDEELAITGKFFVLEDWPAGIAKPNLVFLTAAVPGPVLVVKERWLNGVSTLGSVALRQSEEYEFKLVLRGRREGRYHAHPMVAVQGVGPLLGPGAWVQIRGGGPFENLLTLWNGTTIDLETYALPRIATWHAVVFILGAAWLGYWIAQPMLRRSLGVARGAEGELITTRDLRVSAVLGVLTSLVILVGILTTLAAYPHGIPHQVIKVDIPARPQPERIVGVNREVAKYTPATRTLTLQGEVTNKGDEPLRLRQFVTSNVSFLNTAIVPKAEHLLVEETGDGVKPGETKVLTLTMADPVWHEKRLVDLRQPQLRFGGVLIFQGSQGARSLSPVNAQLRPYFKLAE